MADRPLSHPGASRPPYHDGNSQAREMPVDRTPPGLRGGRPPGVGTSDQYEHVPWHGRPLSAQQIPHQQQDQASSKYNNHYSRHHQANHQGAHQSVNGHQNQAGKHHQPGHNYQNNAGRGHTNHNGDRGGHRNSPYDAYRPPSGPGHYNQEGPYSHHRPTGGGPQRGGHHRGGSFRNQRPSTVTSAAVTHHPPLEVKSDSGKAAEENGRPTRIVRILNVGCTHGRLDSIYTAAKQYDEEHPDTKIDLILCPGDFQAVRDNNGVDMSSLVSKVGRMEDFHKYHKGQSVASHLTIFVGGNHESSQYLYEMENGGFIAPNIYYIGRTGVVNALGLRILGFGGIYNQKHAQWGLHEAPPWTEDTKRSIYHQRTWDIARCRTLMGPPEKPPHPIDVVVSHDWPRLATGGGRFRGNFEVDMRSLDDMKKRRVDFRQEIDEYRFSSPLLDELVVHFMPPLWCAAHFHTHYEQTIKMITHPAGENIEVSAIPETKFLALDKPDNHGDFLRLCEVTIDAGQYHDSVELDPEWLWVSEQWNRCGGKPQRSPGDVRPLEPLPIDLWATVRRDFKDKALQALQSSVSRPLDPITLRVRNPMHLTAGACPEPVSTHVDEFTRDWSMVLGSIIGDMKGHVTPNASNMTQQSIPQQSTAAAVADAAKRASERVSGYQRDTDSHRHSNYTRPQTTYRSELSDGARGDQRGNRGDQAAGDKFGGPYVNYQSAGIRSAGPPAREQINCGPAADECIALDYSSEPVLATSTLPDTADDDEDIDLCLDSD